MDSRDRASLQGLKVVSFESRRAREMVELIRRYGGEPIVAPSMREIPLDENRAALDLLPQLERGQFDLLILMTGVGTRVLNEILLTLYPQERIRAAFLKTKLVARGPKPVSVLKALKLQPEFAAPEPNTWREVVATLQAAMEMRGKRVALQEYGVPNKDLVAALESLGALVVSIPIYRWALPEDLAPLHHAIDKILRGDVDVALFTNGAQVEHLFQVAAADKAAESLRLACKRLVVASIGPVCTQVLEQFGIGPDIEPPHPKMGSLIGAVAASAQPILNAKRSV
ncbi:MAG: uroporphyrinogen-III synthase [Alphaproteobacteria bacterium]